MRRTLWGVALTGLLVPAAIAVTAASAAVQSPTGDTCTATGNGTGYALEITIPAGAPKQGAFAFGASGATVTNINVAADPGILSTANLPPNTTGEWLMTNPAQTGSFTATVATSLGVTGSFTVVAVSSSSSTSFEPFRCTLAAGTPSAGNAFTLGSHVYDAANGVWHEPVTVSGRGTISFVQAVATAGAVAAKPVIRDGKLGVKSAGRFDLTLRPTAAGRAELEARGSIELKLSITFSPPDGKPSSKVVSLVLKK